MIKKIFLTILGIIIYLSALLPQISLAADLASEGNNLVPNSSVEIVNPLGTAPQNWQQGRWGTNNTTFEYLNSGISGSRSLKVTISSYNSGDAKWYFDPVIVSPNTQYTFNDSYQANVPTDIVAQIADASGNLSYLYIGTVQASNTPSLTNLNFTSPQNAVKITIFHLINKVGYLQTDNFSLSVNQTPPPPPPPPPPPVPTAILNPSLETADATGKAPANWQTSKWGTNTTTFSYLTTGHTGSKSVRVTLSKYTSGDAKWVFSPVAVKPSTEYYFSDWYQATIPSEIVARFVDSSGKESFQWLGIEAKSTSWKKTNYQFVTPANVSSVTVYHLISAVGNLTTDDYLLKDSLPLVITDNVPNNSLEQTNDGSAPMAWRQENWGTNTASFTYLTTGHTGTRSAKVQLTKYTDGDAKWGYLPQPVIPGGDYRFTDYYQSNVLTHVVVRVINNAGTEKYLGLINAEPSTSWKKYTDTFSVPIDAKQITVLHFISAVGYLATDDYSVLPFQIQGFSQGMVSLTFDDGWEDNYTSVLPLLTQYGFKSTQYYATTYIQEQSDEIYKIQAFAAAGHEIGSHSITHPYLTKLTLAQMDNELSQSKTYLESIVGAGKVTEFASPYGDYNSQVIGEIQKYYRSHRSTDEGYNSKDNFNIYNLRVQNMTNTTTLAQYQEWIRKAQADKVWLIIIYHRIGENPDQFETAPADFAAQMQFVYQSGIAVKTVGQALDIVQAQIK